MRTLVILSCLAVMTALLYQSTNGHRQLGHAGAPFNSIFAGSLGEIPTGSAPQGAPAPIRWPTAGVQLGGSDEPAPELPAPLGTVLAGRNQQEIAEHLTLRSEFVDREGHVIRGREAIAGALADFFAKNSQGQSAAQMDSLRFVESGVAIEDGFTTTTQDEQPAVHTRYTAVEVMQHGKWYVASVRERPWTAVPQPAPAKYVDGAETERSINVRGAPAARK